MNIPYLSLQRVTQMHGDEIRQAVMRVVDSGWYLQGNETKAFEQEYSEYCKSRYCVGCANGLDALTLSLRSYMEMGRISEGDEVIVPANTYIATILAITENKLKPVLVEPRKDTFQIDDSKIEESITERTRAVMIVNLYGYDSYTANIGDICKRHGLLLMVDNAQGHGLTLPDEADVVCHSFYPGKNLGALGDGGCITTNDEAFADMFRTICNYGSSRKYVFDYQGRNSRLDELHASVLRVKLRWLDEDNKRRREIAKRYVENIKNDYVVLPPMTTSGDDKTGNILGVFHIFPVLCSCREELQAYLADNGIGTMIHYPIPPHKQQAYKMWNDMNMPITEHIHECELSLPCNPVMTDEEVEYVIEVINAFKA